MASCAGRQAVLRVSIVVPIGPGDALGADLNRQLLDLPEGFEVIVVRSAGAEWPRVWPGRMAGGRQWHIATAPAGRAVQQNQGAALAQGQWLWFVHADSALGPNTAAAALELACAERAALGWFSLRFLPDGPSLMRLNAFGAWIRSRLFGLPFGDQGLMLRREDFLRLGGFREHLSSGEDHDLVWRARRAGLPLRHVPAPLYTSARKYAAGGWARVTWVTLRATVRQALRFAREASAAGHRRGWADA